MAWTDGDAGHGKQFADILRIPEDRVVCVEHPCIIKNLDNAIKSLGGELHMKNFLLPAAQKLSTPLSLRPEDPLAKRLMSHEATVNNVLLRITLPKRTGGKRKRGSDSSFTYDHDFTSPDGKVGATTPKTGPEVVQAMRDNPTRYTVQPVGTIKESHRFRALPDFQMHSGTIPVLSKVVSNLIDPTISSIKNFQVDNTPGSVDEPALVGPPQFTSFQQPMNYLYQQNPAVSTLVDDQGRTMTYNTQAPPKRAIYAVSADVETVPSEPPAGLPPLARASKWMKQAVRNLAALLETRPIVTRRVAMNKIDWGSETLFKDATQYVGYSFRSGPWRDALVRYGIDPRSDPQYRIYQTLMFQLMSKDKVMAAAKKMADGKNRWLRGERYRKDETPSHIFDGRGITTNGKTWQICDIEDGLLAPLLATPDIRTVCDVNMWGWYHNGTLSLARVIMRDKIGTMLQGLDPDMYQVEYEALLALPARIDASTMDRTYVASVGAQHGGRSVDKVAELGTQIRTMAKQDQHLRPGVGVQQGPAAGKAKPGWRTQEGRGASVSATPVADGLEDQDDVKEAEQGLEDDFAEDVAGEGEGDLNADESDGNHDDGEGGVEPSTTWL